ncbi:hypothetical protein Pla144_29510 [Bythopirellula polymerisocia]|uniref:Uncharacterized protein n=1 Tax=Bythopirellula polymerisocia TaxID=2528003 RepID=A0A5C6CSE5_9BACT|nr:hypothetical protein Pla144_29510 [Bythopirellula polymerisocia]
MSCYGSQAWQFSHNSQGFLPDLKGDVVPTEIDNFLCQPNYRVVILAQHYCAHR